MPRKQTKNESAAILPVSAGKKKVFNDDDDLNEDLDISYNQQDQLSAGVEDEDHSDLEESDGDDDDAPEMVGTSVDKGKAREEEEKRLM
jgi:hypothetical protein